MSGRHASSRPSRRIGLPLAGDPTGVKPQIDLNEPGLLPKPVRPTLAVWLGVLGLMAAVAGWRLVDASSSLQRAIAQSTPLDAQAVVDEPADLPPLRAEVAVAEAVSSRLQGPGQRRWDPPSMSAELFGALPSTIWLRHLVVDAGGAVAVEGEAVQATDIERYAAAITRIPGLRDAPVQALDAGDVDADVGEDGISASTRFRWVIGQSAAEAAQGQP